MNYASFDDVKNIVTGMAKKIPHGVMLGNTTVGHIEWQMYLQRDYLKLDGTPLANASNDYDELLKFAQDNSLITSDTTDKSLFKYNSGTDVLTLPDYIGLCLQGGNTIEEKEAGLPNITGVLMSRVDISDMGMIHDVTGCFKQENKSDSGWNSVSVGSSVPNNRKKTTLDASRSSSIYGNSTTVQPPAITLIPQIKYIKGITVWEELDFNKLMPLGTVINFMGTTAPDYYLACDGTIYNILEYSALANFFEVQFGSKNFFGGDGTTTFAVPDLRGEFLRGTGTNSHTNNKLNVLEGSGSAVGGHQEATTVYRLDGENNSLYVHNDTSYVNPGSYDAYRVSGRVAEITATSKTQAGAVLMYSVRPTNTSVLYCIKYK